MTESNPQYTFGKTISPLLRIVGETDGKWFAIKSNTLKYVFNKSGKEADVAEDVCRQK